MNKKIVFFAIFLSFSFLFSCVKNVWELDPPGVLPTHQIEDLQWSPDGTQLALMEYFRFSPHKQTDYHLYLWSFKDSQLKLVQGNPSEIGSYTLFQWISEKAFLTGNLKDIYEVNINGQFQTHLHTEKEISRVDRGCPSFDTHDLIISASGNRTSTQVPITKDNQTYETSTPLNKLFIKKSPTPSEKDLFELKIENINEKNIPNFGQFISCSPFSNRIYFNYADYGSAKIQHAVAEVNTEQSQLINPLVFLTYPLKISSSGQVFPQFKFVGWKSENTVIYLYKEEKDLRISFYEFNLIDQTLKKWTAISDTLIDKIEQKGVYADAPDFKEVTIFAFSPDFQQVAYVDKKADKLMLSDLNGQNIKTILDIQKDLSREKS